MRLLLSLLLLVTLTQCKNERKIPDNFDYGKVENNVYNNKFFDFEMPVPAGWEVQNKQQMAKLKETGQAMIEESNKELAKEVKASDIATAYLFTAFHHPMDSLSDQFNSSVMIMAENVKGASQVKNGDDYLGETKKAMIRSNMGQKIDPTMHHVKIDGKEFGIMETITTTQGVEIQQDYYASIQKGFALTFILTYFSDEQGDELRKAINKINFR